MPRISELPTTNFPTLGHAFPASGSGETVKLTIAQVRALMAFAASEIATADSSTVQAVLNGLTAGKVSNDAFAAALADVYGKSETPLLVSNISAATTMGGYKNKIRNPSSVVNQRRIFTWSNGVYGPDCWKGNANGKEQILEQVDVPAGTYTLSWAGGGQGRINGGVLSASPITVTVPGNANVSVVVPAGATAVQFEPGTLVTPLEQRPFSVEYILCQWYYQKTFPYNTTPSPNQGFDGCVLATASGTVCSGTWDFCSPMRTGATLTTYNPANDATPGWRNFANTQTVTATISSITERGVNVLGNGAASNQHHGIHFVARVEL